MAPTKGGAVNVWAYLGIAVAVLVVVNILLILFFVVLDQRVRRYDDE